MIKRGDQRDWEFWRFERDFCFAVFFYFLTRQETKMRLFSLTLCCSIVPQSFNCWLENFFLINLLNLITIDIIESPIERIFKCSKNFKFSSIEEFFRLVNYFQKIKNHELLSLAKKKKKKKAHFLDRRVALSRTAFSRALPSIERFSSSCLRSMCTTDVITAPTRNAG